MTTLKSEAHLFTKLLVLSLFVILIVALIGCTSNSNNANQSTQKVTLQIFAANSLSKAMEEAQQAYIDDGHENVKFADTQYKASGELNEMLVAGASADILISASSGSMDTATDKNLIDSSTRQDLFKNDIVMVTNNNSEINNITLEDLKSGKYTICVGDDSVPAGNYAAQSLSTVGIYIPKDSETGKTGAEISGKGGKYSSNIKVITDSSVGNVCKHAESNDVDIAFVYESDVYRFGGVKIVGKVDDSVHKKILYPAAITSTSKNVDDANEFLIWCANSNKSKEIWEKWGFVLA